MIDICNKTAFGLFLESSTFELKSSKFIILNKNDESVSLGSILTNLKNQNVFIKFRNRKLEQKTNLKSARIIFDEKVDAKEVDEDFAIIENEQCLKGKKNRAI